MTKKELKDVFFVRLEELKFQLDREGSIWTMHNDLEIDGENLEMQLLDTFNLVGAIDEIDPSTKAYIESLVNDLIETSNKYKKLKGYPVRENKTSSDAFACLRVYIIYKQRVRTTAWTIFIKTFQTTTNYK